MASSASQCLRPGVSRVSAALFLPARTEADDTLHFAKRDVRYRIRVRYYDYKIFASKLKVTEVDEPTK